MAEERYDLSRPDRDKFQTLWDDYQRRGSVRPDHVKSELPQAPEVYVARTPPAGIPGTDVAGTGTSGDDVPGFADCPIYQLIDPPGTAEDPWLKRVTNLEHTVFNLGTDDVPGDEWVLVVRDKFGCWFVANGNAGGGRWRFVKPTSENADANGMYPGRVQNWTGSAYTDGDYCWIYLAAGETLITGKRYEGEPLSWIEDSQTGTANDPTRIYGIAGNTVECAPDECDEETGEIISWARIKHRAPFEIIGGFSTSACAEGGGTGTAEA